MRKVIKGNPVQGWSSGTSLEAGEFHRRVADKAYDLFLKRGQTEGHELDDWLEAERLVAEQLAAATTLRSPGHQGKHSKTPPIQDRRQVLPRH